MASEVGLARKYGAGVDHRTNETTGQEGFVVDITRTFPNAVKALVKKMLLTTTTVKDYDEIAVAIDSVYDKYVAKMRAKFYDKMPVHETGNGLYDYQFHDIALSAYHKSVLLSWEQGLGKTITAISLVRLRELLGVHQEGATLIICPKAVREEAWFGSLIREWGINGDGFTVFREKKKTRYDLNPLFQLPEWEKYIIGHYALFKPSKNNEKFINHLDFDPSRIKNVIIDESHQIKSHKTLRWKSIHNIIRHILGDDVHITLLSGTPFDKVRDYYAQLKITDSSLVKDMSFNSFDKSYSSSSNAFDGAFGESETMSEVGRDTANWLLRRNKEDVLELPEKHFHRYIVDTEEHRRIVEDTVAVMKAKARIAEQIYRTNKGVFDSYFYLRGEYAELKEEYDDKLMEWEDSPFQLAADKPDSQPQLMARRKLEQFRRKHKEVISAYNRLVSDSNLSGAIMSMSKLNSKAKVKEMAKVIRAIVDEGKKVVVFSGFTDTLKRLERIFSEECVLINGNTSSTDRAAYINQFQRGRPTVFLGNIKAAGTGITLHASHKVIYMDFPLSIIDFLQSLDRVHRSGQKHEVDYYLPIVPDSVDEVIYEILDRKVGVFSREVNANVNLSESEMANVVLEGIADKYGITDEVIEQRMAGDDLESFTRFINQD